MANEKSNKEDKSIQKPDRRFRNIMGNLTGVINDLQSSIYGISDSEELDATTQQFHDILGMELKNLNGSGTSGDEDMSSFIAKLYNNKKRENKLSDIFNKEVSSMSLGSDDTTVGSFLTEVYKNKLIRQSDIHDIASQLIELKEAVNTMRDAIITADIVDGRINREITFKGLTSDKVESYMSTIQTVEEKFDIQRKIKSYIIRDGLTYGEYYANVMPYSEIFSNFMKNKKKYNMASMYSFESVDLTDEQRNERKNSGIVKNLSDDDDVDVFIESCYENFEFSEDTKKEYAIKNGFSFVEDTQKINKGMKDEFTEGFKELLSRVTVINEYVPLAIMDEGEESISYFRECFVDESGEHFTEDVKKPGQVYSDNSFLKFMKDGTPVRKIDSSEGISFEDDEKESKEFEDIKDCYVKMIEPTKLIEIAIMDEVIGYFYIRTDNVTPISGILSSTLYQTRMNKKQSERDIIGDVAARIIEKFDRKFLKDNPKFKKLIVEALNFYDLNQQAVTFQYIPKEYIVPFKVDPDIDGNGTSMLDGSLFYAKLYMMLLLFKIMSIILNSNDTKVNYIRQSGIDKDLINKVQQIAIQKQARNINIMDLFNYTSLINKIGTGNELFIPTGRGNERPMETDILGGQDVQINNELMELLRNSYILGTGVPAAIINYLNEADFAKSIEVANTKFNGRVVNYQLDFNKGITELYRKILMYSSNIPKADLDNLSVTLVPPKGAQNNIKTEQIQNFTTIIDFLVQLYFGETQNEEGEEDVIRKFKIGLAKKLIPSMKFEEIEEVLKEAKIKGVEEQLKPKDEPKDEDILGPM